jgi:hypothetical protein
MEKKQFIAMERQLTLKQKKRREKVIKAISCGNDGKKKGHMHAFFMVFSQADFPPLSAQAHWDQGV